MLIKELKHNQLKIYIIAKHTFFYYSYNYCWQLKSHLEILVKIKNNYAISDSII